MVAWSGDAHPTPTPSPGRCHAVVDDLLERRGTARRNEQESSCSLNKGQHVSFEVVQGEKGPQAEKVHILG
ncbi:cold-shock protein [Streptomyces sp. NPDC059862]|uniref:cold-shock protein n=1 Tax=unclassified Streptomyces TaxID=2593676 RepID=UPI00363E0474